VFFEGFVYAAGKGQVFHATTKPFDLQRGTKVYGYRDVMIDRTQTAPGYEVFVTRSGQLPAGSYRFRLILQPLGVGDSFSFEQRPMAPPRLISPVEGATVVDPRPVFSWTTPNPVPKSPVTYKLRVYQILDGQTSKEAVVANRPWFEQTGIRAMSLTYPASGRALAGKHAWVVEALWDGVGATSEVREFVAARGGPSKPEPSGSRSSGTAVAVWQHRTTPGDWEIWYADLDLGSMTATAAPLVPTGYPGHDMDPAIAFDRDGTATAVWAHYFGSPWNRWGIVFSRRPDGGDWTEPQPIAFTYGSSPVTAYMDPAVAFDEDGTGLCVFVRDGDAAEPKGGQKRFWYSRFDGTVWGTPAQLPDIEGEHASDSSRIPEITFTSVSGQAVFFGIARGVFPCYSLWNGAAWSPIRYVPSGQSPSVTTAYRYYPGTPFPVPAEKRLGVASDNNGKVVAVWQPSSGALQYSVRDVAALATSWSPPALSYAGGTLPAAALGTESPVATALSTLVQGGQVTSASGAASLPTATETAGPGFPNRTAVAWVDDAPTAVAVWAKTVQGTDADIIFSKWDANGWTPGGGVPITSTMLTGVDCNADVAAPSGSHTMPPQ
jgi:hypothetical protein